MNKKLIAAVLALCMLVSISAVALAEDDGTEADVPADVTGRKPSSGAATVAGDTFDVTGDDDATGPADTDLNDADISLWGRITDGADTAEKVYKLDVAWDNLIFRFTFSGDSWNPQTYEYESSNSGYWGGAARGENNNGITVTNHSNNCIDASFSFEMARGENAGDTIFNKAPTGNETRNLQRVVGNFFLDDGKAEEAQRRAGTYPSSAPDAVPYHIDGAMTATDKLQLYTAAAYNPNENPEDATSNQPAGARSGEVFFAFSGIPDRNAFYSLYETNVGTITVTFAPGTLVAYPPYDG